MTTELSPFSPPSNAPVGPAIGQLAIAVEPAIWVEQVRLPIANLQDVLVARFVGRDEAAKLGLAAVIQTRVATVISEITRNIVQHAGGPGEIRLGRMKKDGRPGLRIIVVDYGRGIENPGKYLAATKAGGLGAGLPGTRRLADRFDLQSCLGAGTTVTTEFWTPEAPR